LTSKTPGRPATARSRTERRTDANRLRVEILGSRHAARDAGSDPGESPDTHGARQVSKGEKTHGRNERLSLATATDATDSSVVPDPGVGRLATLFGAMREGGRGNGAIGSEA
jgi:hypothetical protein